jgi:hypothetical protein
MPEGQASRVEILCVYGSLLDRVGGCGRAEWRSCVWVPGLVGLRQSEYCAVLCRLGDMVCKAEIKPCWGVWPSEMELLQCCAGFGSLAGKAEIMQGWRAWPCKTELLQGCAGLGGVAGQNRDHECLYFQHGRPWGMAQQSRDLPGLCRPWGCGLQSRDHAGLGGMAQQNGAPAGLCRPVVGEGPGLAEIVNVCGSLALRAHPMEILKF